LHSGKAGRVTGGWQRKDRNSRFNAATFTEVMNLGIFPLGRMRIAREIAHPERSHLTGILKQRHRLRSLAPALPSASILVSNVRRALRIT
jgi:hypothetical protein